MIDFDWWNFVFLVLSGLQGWMLYRVYGVCTGSGWNRLARWAGRRLMGVIGGVTIFTVLCGWVLSGGDALLDGALVVACISLTGVLLIHVPAVCGHIRSGEGDFLTDCF